MILIDSSIWIEHLRSANAGLALALAEGQVVQHPFVTAELALGSLAARDRFVAMLDLLPAAPTVDQPALLAFISEHRLFGTGLGMVDAHLLASAAARGSARLWTGDRRLAGQAERLGFLYQSVAGATDS
ncbi:MAG TPA: PIN domain-containing protein [Sphingopyxis sp.]|mgnify:CR=1 FL=1|nr:PIN domain-containing protein [Sphingopyxis sp.]HMP44492.1 PIN domain-containing protein [Sphingopyxis sp.]HMQ18915.1 PIN domain-containing protein [Sphingopyxis sp.]